MQALLYFFIAVIGIVVLLAAFVLPIWMQIKNGNIDNSDCSEMTGSFDLGVQGIACANTLQFPDLDADDPQEIQKKTA